MNKVLHEMAERKRPPVTDLDGPGVLASRPLTVPEAVMMMLIVAAPLLFAFGHEWYDARFNQVTKQAIAEAKAMKAANDELVRILLVEQSRVAAMRAELARGQK